MKKIGIGLIMVVVAILIIGTIHAGYQMKQPVSSYKGYEIVETAVNIPGSKDWYTKWDFSHQEKFNFATVHYRGSGWYIYTDKFFGRYFDSSKVKVSFKDIDSPAVVYYTRAVFEKTYMLPGPFPIPLQFISPRKSIETKIEIVVPDESELQKRIFPHGTSMALSKALSD